jgi:hypothetical protein
MGFKPRQRPAQRPASIDKLLSGEEQRLVAFKPSAAALEAEDLVALANTEDGGTIVLGLEPAPKRRRKAEPTVVGCSLTVATRKAIASLAQACVPPVEVTVSEAVHQRKKLVRIDVAKSDARPHCTASGTYVVRDGDAIVPLTRDRLEALLGGGSSDGAALRALTAGFKRLERKLEENARRLDDNGRRLDENGRRLDYYGRRLGFNSKLLEENRKFIRLVAGHTGLKLMLEPPRPPVMLVQLRRDDDEAGNDAHE